MNDQNSVEQDILRIGWQIFEAIKAKDVATLGRLVASDFVHRSPDGTELDKAEFLENIRTLPVEVTKIRGEHERVRMLGDVAVMTGVQHANWRQGETEGISSVAFTDVFQLREDAWILVLAHGVDLPA